MDSAKVNIAPPMSEAKWFRLVGVEIGNASDLYPHGDTVQTVEPWTPPDSFAGLSNVTLNQILTDIEAGTPDGNRYTDAPNAIERAAWRVIDPILGEVTPVYAYEPGTWGPAEAERLRPPEGWEEPTPAGVTP